MVDVEKISKLVKRHFRITGTFQVNPLTGEVNVQGDVHFKALVTSKGVFPVEFGEVTGDFYCGDQGILSLKGAPHTVHGDFNCNSPYENSRYQLTTLEYAPKIVHGRFICANNLLTNLIGAPEHVGGSFSCTGNKLTKLQGAPRTVGDNFLCYSNKLTSLQGGPMQVGGNYDCRYNPLTSLEGLPQVLNSLSLRYNKNRPLLRLLDSRIDRLNLIDTPKSVTEVLKKYAGQGKPGALKAAADLIRAGYAENARW